MATETKESVKTIIRGGLVRASDAGSCMTCDVARQIHRVVEIEVGVSFGKTTSVYKMRFCQSCSERVAGVLRGAWRS